MKIKLFLILALCSITLSNCKKNKERSPDILTSKNWHRGLTDENPSTNPKGRVLYYAVKNCEKDDIFKFNSDGKLILNRNKEQCDQNELQTEYQNYTLNRATKELIINGTKYSLAEESSSQIKYYTAIPSGTGYEYLIFLLQ